MVTKSERKEWLAKILASVDSNASPQYGESAFPVPNYLADRIKAIENANNKAIKTNPDIRNQLLNEFIRGPKK